MESPRRLTPTGLLRRFAQIVSLLFFVYLLLFTRAGFENSYYIVASPISPNLFMRADPLLFSALILTAKAILAVDFLPMLVLLFLTLIFGRFFCGWLCPLGTLFDFMPSLLPTRKQNPQQKPYHNFKYYLLLLILLLALLGLNIVGIFDPLTILFSSLTYAIFPYIDYVLRGFIGIFYRVSFLTPIAQKIDADYYQPIMGITPKIFQYSWVYVTIFLTLLSLIMIQRRYWCRYLCPLGAMIGFLSRPSLYRRRVSEACTQCEICFERCRMNSIGKPAEVNAHQECIMCLECEEVCPEDAIRFYPFWRKGKALDCPIDQGKRNLLKTFAGALFFLPLIKAAVGTAEKTRDPYLLRAPGALTESEFINRCVRCGECMRVCPENALHPALFQANLEGLWSSIFVPRLGYCAYDCNLCGKVCPSGAIQYLPISEKKRFIIGWAYFDLKTCLPWAQNIECSVCEEACPTSPKAIILREEQFMDDEGNLKTIKRPYVVESECIGCGICENKCPLPGESAIRVRLVPEVKV